jgi:hypothetical protein
MGRLQIFESIEAISTVSITLTSLSSIAQVLRQFQDASLILMMFCSVVMILAPLMRRTVFIYQI